MPAAIVAEVPTRTVKDEKIPDRCVVRIEVRAHSRDCVVVDVRALRVRTPVVPFRVGPNGALPAPQLPVA